MSPVFRIRGNLTMLNHLFRKHHKRAFTLYELVITVALFGLVAGLVLSFISSVDSYNEKNAIASKRVNQLLSVRREADFWFSVFDSPEYTLFVGKDGGMYALKEEERYEITLGESLDKDGNPVLTAVFTYPESKYRESRTEIVCDCVSAVYFFDYSDFPDTSGYVAGSGEKVLNFTFAARVTGKVYACDVVYR